MNSLMAIAQLTADPVIGAVQQAAVFASSSVNENIGSNLVKVVRNIVGPVVLLAVGLVALTYLMKRQVTQFLQFVALAVLIGVFFYTNALQGLVNFVAGLFGGSSITP